MTGIGSGKTWGGKDLEVGKDLEATLAACRPWNEPRLKNFAKLPRLGCE
jgi:hypothetical protein